MPIVGDVASLGGVTVSNVRFYEAERLIHATRTAGNQCLYGPVSSTYASFK
ncbi:MerR family DNA-binding transcriptional regulator [Pseudomonas aeruginosa]|uniref:MerR family DNA-binding transcriptional regulator n=1 Tax=Pseudomonas aeruginosa TaxID=287 RepID=UPI00106D3445|nr:MerR family DNA-binding transcriptional regulator [Pseudomonas aeruginosa]MCT7341973.1 MerR family DNA-binding transcriptional regulator [Pseudomonas aeruginosa]